MGKRPLPFGINSLGRLWFGRPLSAQPVLCASQSAGQSFALQNRKINRTARVFIALTLPRMSAFVSRIPGAVYPAGRELAERIPPGARPSKNVLNFVVFLWARECARWLIAEHQSGRAFRLVPCAQSWLSPGSKGVPSAPQAGQPHDLFFCLTFQPNSGTLSRIGKT